MPCVSMLAHSSRLLRYHPGAPADRPDRWIRIRGVTRVMLAMSRVDRANVALALPAMRAEPGLSATAIGLATGGFFRGS